MVKKTGVKNSTHIDTKLKHPKSFHRPRVLKPGNISSPTVSGIFHDVNLSFLWLCKFELIEFDLVWVWVCYFIAVSGSGLGSDSGPTNGFLAEDLAIAAGRFIGGPPGALELVEAGRFFGLEFINLGQIQAEADRTANMQQTKLDKFYL